MDLYAENILDHFRNPRNKGTLEDPTLEHEEKNTLCGDELTVQLVLNGETIEKLQWEGRGCAISQAAISMLSEELQGASKEHALQLTKDDIFAMLGVPIGPRRLKCALLCLDAVHNALTKA